MKTRSLGFVLCLAACAPSEGPLVVAPIASARAGADAGSAILDGGPDAPASRPAADDREAIVGDWTEEFESRSGCSDDATIAWEGDALVIHGDDCNDGTPYVFEGVTYRAGTLRFRARVPQTGYVGVYELTRDERGDLRGEVTIRPPNKALSQHFRVRWVRR